MICLLAVFFLLYGNAAERVQRWNSAYCVSLYKVTNDLQERHHTTNDHWKTIYIWKTKKFAEIENETGSRKEMEENTLKVASAIGS